MLAAHNRFYFIPFHLTNRMHVTPSQVQTISNEFMDIKKKKNRDCYRRWRSSALCDKGLEKWRGGGGTPGGGGGGEGR